MNDGDVYQVNLLLRNIDKFYKDTLPWKRITLLDYLIEMKFPNSLTDILRAGARRLIMQAVEAEFTEFIAPLRIFYNRPVAGVAFF
ncbi:MAG: hypothetical protein HRT36_00400 [Alphaproteobacteria bacterium]|nr:hypothetical protein [Alphaproteobacteria bacterium]